jgi:hypothetical protein
LKKSSTCVLSLFSTLLILLTTLSSSAAADYSSVGVHMNDTADYTQSVSPGYLPYSLITRLHLTITSITGIRTGAPHVTFTLSWYFSNGTLYSNETFSGDLSKGELLYYLVVANLAAGDLIGIGSPYRINETITMPVLDTPEPVNHLSFAVGSGESYDIYYEQSSGLMVKSMHRLYSVWQNTTVTGMKIGTIDWNSLVLGISVFAVIFVVLILVLRVVRHRRS